MVLFWVLGIYVFLLLFCATVFVGFCVFIFSEFWGKKWAYKVPFVPTSSTDTRLAISFVPLNEHDVVYDVGCGDGRVLFAAARAGAGKCVGFEIAPWPYVVARIRAFFARSHVTFVRDDFFKHSFVEATVIYSYLLPHVVTNVQEKILQECKPGTVVVSRDYPYTRLTEVQRMVHGKHTLFVYRV